MSKAGIYIQWQHKAACLLIAAMVVSGTADAQLSLKRQKYDDIAERYKNEHAVVTNQIHKLVIKEEDNALTANSYYETEKLFISEKSLNVYNTDEAEEGTFNYLTHLDATYYLPYKNDYKMLKSTGSTGRPKLKYTGLTKKAITHTTYSEWHSELRLLPSFIFCENVPVVNAVFELTAPKFVKMGFMVKGADTSMIKRTVTEKDGMIIYRFTASNVPAVKTYSDVPSPLYYFPHVVPYIVSFRATGAKKDSVMSGSIDALRKMEYGFVKGLNLKTDSFLNKKTKELTRGAYSDRDKVARIYNWVQKNFHYEALFLDDMQGFVPNPADTVCKRMYGDCKDMTSIIVAMCKKSGISAYHAIIGSNKKPYTHDDITTQHLYNHMIAAVKLDGEWVFLDGTTYVLPLGANRVDLQGKEALILIDDHNHKIVKIPEAHASDNVIVDNTYMSLTNNDVTGTTYQHFTGYPAWDLADALAYLNRKEDKDKFVRSLAERGNSKFLVSRYDINASDRANNDVSLNTHYTLGGYAQKVKRDYFVNMNVNKTIAAPKVDDENRNVAVYLDYKKTVKETVTLNIPKGYRVSYLPKAAKGGVAGLWNYSIAYKADTKANTVTLTKEYEMNTMKINPDQFEAHNKLVDDVRKQYKETVVLTAK